jgi:Na+(H+)/acetate symporter ActP
MRAVTWTQVAQYLVLILAYLVPLTWLSVQQTGSLMPAFGHGTQLDAIAQREAALSQDPAERDVAGAPAPGGGADRNQAAGRARRDGSRMRRA